MMAMLETVALWVVVPGLIAYLIVYRRQDQILAWLDDRRERRQRRRVPRPVVPAEPIAPLSDILRAWEGIDERHLDRAKILQDRSGHQLAEVLEQIGAATPGQLDRARAIQHALPAIDPDPHAIPRGLLSALPEDEAESLGVLPVREEGDPPRVLLACAEPLDDDVIAVLTARLSRPIELAICGGDRLVRARQRAYRRLRREDIPGASPQLLGERLIEAGVLNEENLRELLSEQRQTDEHLAEILVRKGLLEPEDIATIAEGPLGGGYVAVRPEEVDPHAMRRIGYGACAFHTLVPLRKQASGGEREIVSAYPLHHATISLLEKRLCEPVSTYLAPRTQLRAARMIGARTAWPRGILDGETTCDMAELALIAEFDRCHPARLARFVEEMRTLGRSPLSIAAREGLCSAADVRRLMAEVYLIEDRLEAGEPRRGWLPPELERTGEAFVVEATATEVCVATPRPRPELARTIRALHPERTVRWIAADPLAA